VRIISLRRCAGKARDCVEAASDHAHLAYLVAAVVAEGNLALRLTSGGCLVFCVAGRVLKIKESH
jgi:hypothetical protein